MQQLHLLSGCNRLRLPILFRFQAVDAEKLCRHVDKGEISSEWKERRVPMMQLCDTGI